LYRIAATQKTAKKVEPAAADLATGFFRYFTENDNHKKGRHP
jgi:hypothetical protein